MFLYTLIFFFGLARVCLAAYSLADDYSGANFANMMTFFTDTDPTAGYVNYVDQSTAQSSGLFSASGGTVRLAVDSTSVVSGRGRNSVRTTSNKQYNHALIVLDIGHMPGDICGVWPAFWTTGPNWPSEGEIDIIEGVNKQTTNKMTLHSNPGCTINGNDCEGSTGCSVNAGTYGDSINSANGAVYAMEWTSDGVNIWSWAHGAAPADATSGTPDPSGWGDPTGSFPSSSSCNVDTFFKNQNIVFDTTFCGVWAGDVWASTPACSALASTCQDYVQNNPSAFANAFWSINSLKVYTNGGGSSSSGTTTTGGTTQDETASTNTTDDTPPVRNGGGVVTKFFTRAHPQATAVQGGVVTAVVHRGGNLPPSSGGTHWGGHRLKGRAKRRSLDALGIEAGDVKV